MTAADLDGHLVVTDSLAEHGERLTQAGRREGKDAVELELAERLLAREWELRVPIAQIWRSLAEAGGEAEGSALRTVLAGAAEYPRTPETAARCVRVLTELGLCEWPSDRAAAALRGSPDRRHATAASLAASAARRSAPMAAKASAADLIAGASPDTRALAWAAWA